MRKKQQIKNTLQEINICLSTDDNYIQYTATVVASILSNAKKSDNYHFYILAKVLQEKNKKYFLELKKIKNCDISFLDVSENLLKNFVNIEMHQHLNLSVYNRLFIPDLLPHIDKVIYLDSDIVVVNNIADLNNIDMGDNLFLGVLDPFADKHSANLGYSNYPYINSGVLLINCQKLRSAHYLDKLVSSIEYLKDKAKAGDQDFINYCFHKKIGLISSIWNVFLPFNYKRYGMNEPKNDDYLLSKKHPHIIHFVGPVKPWMKDASHPYKDKFLQYYRKTKFWTEKQKEHRKQVLNQIIKGLIPKIDKIQKDNKIKYTLLLGNKKLFRYSLRKDEKVNIIENKEIIEQIKAFIDKKYTEQLKNIRHDMYFIQSVSALHTKTFAKYKNINRGKDVVLLASGPSLENYIPIKNAVYVGVNKAYSYKKCKLDYLFIQDYDGSKKYMNEVIDYKNNKNLKVFMGLTGYTPNDQWLIPESVALQCNAERYYNLYRPEEKVWGEDFTYDILNAPLKCFGSITFAAMQFILWTNPKRIYLVGCDNSLAGYANNISQEKNKLDTMRCLEGYRKLKKFADKFYPKTEIISINPVGLKGIFNDELQSEKEN